MSDYLLQNQVKDGRKLTLPEGLNELMSDISREVLRSQPEQLYPFISNYLAALLLTREHLAVAARVHQDTCSVACRQGLVDELAAAGLRRPVEAADVIVAQLEKGAVNEEALLKKILSCSSVPEQQLPSVREVLVHAFVRHRMRSQDLDLDEDTSSTNLDPISRAVRHTMRVYQQTGPTPADAQEMSRRVSAAYRAYRGPRAARGSRASLSEDRWADVSGGSTSSDSMARCSGSYSKVNQIYMNGASNKNPRAVSSSSTSFVPLAPTGTRSQFYCSVAAAPEVIDLAVYRPVSDGPEPAAGRRPTTSVDVTRPVTESADPKLHLLRPIIVIGYPSEDDVSRSRLDHPVPEHEDVGQSDNDSHITIDPAEYP